MVVDVTGRRGKRGERFAKTNETIDHVTRFRLVADKKHVLCAEKAKEGDATLTGRWENRMPRKKPTI